ncbi:Uncharacterized protein dnm_044970 [Desulfonema magnum]|uniref:Uncharacterized protein n=1 Tax=Desulfonema magnum TaxID=45655 RepID=A0A975GNY5_9BACT|nr:Uncharacterized protein dnm_044970 [Desulfonema magnum]
MNLSEKDYIERLRMKLILSSYNILIKVFYGEAYSDFEYNS